MFNQQYYTFLLSQIFGLFIFILAVTVMGRMHYYRKMILQLKSTNPIIVVGAILGLFIGIILVVTHNNWTNRSAAWISAFSWLTFILSILWLALPERMLNYTKKVCSGMGYYWLMVFLLIFGILVIGRGVQLFIVHHSMVGL